MKLLKLTLSNWRGVAEREVVFADGVTLIEGPNEIGKSTLVEAIRHLFETLHSSSSAKVKAIQPVGQDVGSSVEGEIKAGDYHFIYSKTFNRDKQATLKVLAPRPEQLTGREAHERAEQILAETVDMALWNALLVEQGNEIAGVTLSQSNGLARALDEAAGGTSPEQDDSDLYARVQTEYEQYFTLKTGKPKYAGLESDLHTARTAVDEARSALAEVEADSAEHERVTAEVRRLELALPELKKAVAEHEAHWQAISTIKEQVTGKQAELDAARQLLQAASEEQARRAKLLQSVADGTTELQAAQAQLAPQDARAKDIKQASEQANAALTEGRGKLKEARAATELARMDEQHLQNAEQLAASTQRLVQVQKCNAALAAARKSLQGVRIDADGLEELRAAEGELQVALGRLEAAASSIEITAASKLQLTLNDEPLQLAAGEAAARSIAAEVRVAIPGVASIRVVPSQSVNELESAADECKQELARLLKKYGAEDLADAVAIESRRAAAAQEVASWTEKLEELLQGYSEAEWQTEADDYQTRCKDYLAERAAEPALPATPKKAAAATRAAEQVLSACEEALEVQQTAFEQLRDEHNDVNAALLVAAQEVSGLERAVNERRQQLAEARAGEDDSALTKRLNDRSAIANKLQAEFAALQAQLESVSPAAAEALLDNAREASQRADKDLRELKTRLAVLAAHLSRAQANGRFETLEAAEQKRLAVESEYVATERRAAAAKRLYEVLSTHRDSTRKAYVRPLKDGIEQLGKIVFGADFSVELDDNWTLVSCTREGKTIPFEDLSVGAKEQIGILTRLAAARIVASQGGVPLIIDDALGFSDPARLAKMGAAIATAGRDCQVILLTCTPGRFMHVGSAEVVRL